MFEDRNSQTPALSAFKSRILLVTAVFLLGIGLLLARIFYLTVVRGQDLYYLSEQNFLRQVKIPAPRGAILDRHGRILATSEPRYNLLISPYKEIPRSQLRHTLQSVSLLVPDIRLPDTETILKNQPKWSRKILAQNLKIEAILPLLERQASLPGLIVEQSFVRV